MTEEESVYSALEAVVEDLASEAHRDLAALLLERLSGVEPDDQLEALRRLIKDMVREVDVVDEEAD
jgi:hypothetical protein